MARIYRNMTHSVLWRAKSKSSAWLQHPLDFLRYVDRLDVFDCLHAKDSIKKIVGPWQAVDIGNVERSVFLRAQLSRFFNCGPINVATVCLGDGTRNFRVP